MLKEPDCDIPIQVIMLALYTELQLGNIFSQYYKYKMYLKLGTIVKQECIFFIYLHFRDLYN